MSFENSFKTFNPKKNQFNDPFYFSDRIDQVEKKLVAVKKAAQLLLHIKEKELSIFLKKIKVIGRLIRIIKKYLPQTTCKKCISELKYFAIPSIIGRTDQAVRFKIIAFIGFFIKELYTYYLKKILF